MLSLEHISKTYADGTRALTDINLAVRESEIVALVGGSGCGKTTLLRLIAGLDRASNGRIRLDDETITEPHPAIGIVFQEPRLLPWLSVADNVGFGLDHAEPGERTARVGHALEKIGATFRAASSSVWRSRVRSSPIPRCCCSTSLSRPSMRSRGPACMTICSVFGTKPARPS
ncbi:MAG: nitrate/sulfonate/bicarbonate transporter ATP-binding protein [Microvirga sp.]|nr:nitrate/sulfonate/bicarbonate transporter ATP-binding protein [Microvirga sp.]